MEGIQSYKRSNSHPGASFPYFELSGFKDLPTLVDLGIALEVLLMVYVEIEIIVLVEIH
jgi:hypothetical protein